MAQHQVYHDIPLIEKTMRDHGIDPEDAQTFHKLRGKQRDVVAADLAARSGAEEHYCSFVLKDYFGQGRNHVTAAKKAKEDIDYRIRLNRMYVAMEVATDTTKLLETFGYSKRTTAAKSVLSAIRTISSDLSEDERASLKLHPGVGAAAQYVMLKDILNRYGFGHLMPKHKIKEVKK